MLEFVLARCLFLRICASNHLILLYFSKSCVIFIFCVEVVWTELCRSNWGVLISEVGVLFTDKIIDDS